MKQEQGAVSILVMLALVAVAILSGAFVRFGLFEHRFSEFDNENTQAFYLAESAVDQGFEWLRNQQVPPPGTTPVVLFGGWLTHQKQNFAAGGSGEDVVAGWTMVRLVPDAANPTSQILRYTIEGWGATGASQASPNVLRQTSLIVQTESFARYAYFTNEERSWPDNWRVYFITGDLIEGPTHTNGQYSMYGDPVFDGPVSSVSDSIYYYGGAGSSNPVFNQGLRLGIPVRQFPSSYPGDLITAASNGGMALQGDTEVNMLGDGTMRVTNSDQGWEDSVQPVPANGVLYVQGGDVNLQGTVSGQVTVGASGDVRIVDNVTYAQDPRTVPESQDILGIVAGEDVLIDQDAPHDVTIHGAIMALNHSFGVEHWWQGPARGTLGVFGGIIQANRGIVGTFSGSTGQQLSGYSKDYHYDQRLHAMAPPFFPVTSEYISLLWQDE